MKHHTVGADFVYRFNDARADVTGFFDAVASHLFDLDAEDVFLAVDRNQQSFRLSLLVTSAADERVENIIAAGMGTMRTAFQACGAATPEWPEKPTEAVCKVEVASVDAVMNEIATGDNVKLHALA